MTPRQVAARVDAIIEPFVSYAKARDALFQAHFPGLLYYFALQYVDADIRNGGIYQLHSNSTGCLILDAEGGARAFRQRRLADVLKEIIYYYDSRGRSRLRKRIPPDYFSELSGGRARSLTELEQRYYRSFGKHESMDELLESALAEAPELFPVARSSAPPRTRGGIKSKRPKPGKP